MSGANTDDSAFGCFFLSSWFRFRLTDGLASSKVHPSTHPPERAMSDLLDLLLTPAQRKEVAAADAIAKCEAAFATYRQAKPAFDSDYGAYTGHPMDPRTDDSDDLTPDDAREQATNKILSHPESVADWMAKACDCDEGRIALDVSAVDAVQIIDGSPALLVAVLMTGDNTQALRALHKLRELAAKAFAAEIDSRTAELLAEGAL